MTSREVAWLALEGGVAFACFGLILLAWACWLVVYVFVVSPSTVIALARAPQLPSQETNRWDS